MKKLLLFVPLCVAALFLAGCGGNYVVRGPIYFFDGSDVPAVTEVLLDGHAELISTAAQDSEAVTAAQGANDFAFRFGAVLLEAEGVTDENFVVSPYSVWMPLAALVNATDEYHRPVFIEALGAAGISAEDINRAASRMLFDLTNEAARLGGWAATDDPSPLQIANAVFVDYAQTIQTDFAQTFMDYFRGTMMNVDFSAPEAVDIVNQWAYDNTNGRIERVVEEFDPSAAAAIANAIYFSDGWFTEFNPNLTHQRVFRSPNVEEYAYFMQRTGEFDRYFEDERIQAVDLRFNSGGMFILLPKDGDAVGLLSSMTARRFTEIQNNAERAQGNLLLPRFAVENTLNGLEDALSAMGMDALFCRIRAPLNGLIYHPMPAFISEAVQVAMIEVDEEGATAAAVTIMVAVPSSAPLPPERTFEMVCDTPFAFILYSRTTDGGSQVLFTGVVNQP